jgi:hypothetical protein
MKRMLLPNASDILAMERARTTRLAPKLSESRIRGGSFRCTAAVIDGGPAREGLQGGIISDTADRALPVHRWPRQATGPAEGGLVTPHGKGIICPKGSNEPRR